MGSYRQLIESECRSLFGNIGPRVLYRVTGRVPDIMQQAGQTAATLNLIFRTLDNQIPFVAPMDERERVVNPSEGIVHHFSPLVPLPWVVGYWVEGGLMEDEQTAWEHLKKLGLREDGTFVEPED